jgi:hypothetical protein
MIEKNLRIPKRDRNKQHPAPVRDLHHAENTERDEIGEAVPRQLRAWIACEQFEFGQRLPDEGERSQHLDREQQQIDASFSLLVVGFHPADDIGSTGGRLNLACDDFSDQSTKEEAVRMSNRPAVAASQLWRATRLPPGLSSRHAAAKP